MSRPRSLSCNSVICQCQNICLFEVFFKCLCTFSFQVQVRSNLHSQAKDTTETIAKRRPTSVFSLLLPVVGAIVSQRTSESFSPHVQVHMQISSLLSDGLRCYQWLKCNGTQGNSPPPIYDSKRSPTSDCYNARKRHTTMSGAQT